MQVYNSGRKRYNLGYKSMPSAVIPSHTENSNNMDISTTPPADVYTKDDRVFLLELARRTISDVVLKSKPPQPHLSQPHLSQPHLSQPHLSQPHSAQISEKLEQRRACFVTLRLDGKLRGCIGNILPEKPLYKTVMHMATSAATRDSRFQPVATDEVDRLHIEISVLSVPQPLEFDSPQDLLEKLRPGVDGVVLKLGPRHSTFLPQVWEHLPDKREFLARLCEKAKLAPTDWRNSELKIDTYQVEAF